MQGNRARGGQGREGAVLFGFCGAVAEPVCCCIIVLCPLQVHRWHGARCVPDHCEGEGSVHQRDQPIHQGKTAHPVRGRTPRTHGGAGGCCFDFYLIIMLIFNFINYTIMLLYNYVTTCHTYHVCKACHKSNGVKLHMQCVRWGSIWLAPVAGLSSSTWWRLASLPLCKTIGRCLGKDRVKVQQA